MFEVTKDKYEISLWEDELVPAEEQRYEKFNGEINLNETYYQSTKDGYKPIPRDEVETFDKNNIYLLVPQKLSFFQERKIAVIGANGHNAPEFVYNPKFIDDVKGEHTLTFTMNSKYYDEESETFVNNPYMKYMVNERKVKLFFRDKWYDLLIKKIEENKKNYAYTFTANDLYINELGKNGVKVELDVELENNQGTAEELAAQVLEDTDWQVSSYTDNEKYKSDLLVETNLDTLYKAYLCKDILVKVSADGWLPIREDEVEPEFIPEVDDRTTTLIKKGEPIYLFYSDLIAKNPEPMILYRKNEAYQTNTNEDIIINSYNFRVTRENKVTYTDADVPLPEFIVYDEYMPVKLSISSDSTKYFCQPNPETDKIEFVTEEPENYKGTIYQKQDEGKFGIILEENYRAYETVRRAETGYDPVTDEFVTYFLQRLYTLDYKLTEDEVPYSNKAYFTKTDKGYERFYGYTFDGQEYYELDYREFLKDGEELDPNKQYYVKSKVPEYVPTIDKDPNYYSTTQYKNGQTYYYFNPVIRQYVQVRFNDENEFNSFNKTIYYKENKNYYIYKEELNEYVDYGNLEIFIPAKQVYQLLIETDEDKEYVKKLDIPTNLDYFVYDYERTEMQDGEEFDYNKNVYYTLNSDNVTYTEITGLTGGCNYEYTKVSEYAVYNPYVEYYTKHTDEEENVYYVKANITKFDSKTTYYVRTSETYYYHKIPHTEVQDGKEVEVPSKTYVPVKYPKQVDIMKNDDAIEYYIKTISAALPLYAGKFVYEQSGKMIDGFIKYEESEWSRIKGYIDTEYISPTLVQNFLANSVEMTSLTSGWLFDGSPNDKNRAGELTNRLDDPTRADPDEDTEGSMLILHLTDKPVHYASQTGDYLYTSYDFVVENPMITQEEFWGQNRYYNKEEYNGTYPKSQFTKISANEVISKPDVKVFKVETKEENGKVEAPYLEQVDLTKLEEGQTCVRAELTSSGPIWDFITKDADKVIDKKYIYYIVNNIEVKDVDYGKNFIKDGDTEDSSQWVDPTYTYFVYTGESIFDYYCISIGEGKYQTTDKIYVRIEEEDSYSYQRILRYDPQFETYYYREDGKFIPLNYHEARRYKQGVHYFRRIEENKFELANINSKWEFLFFDEPLYVYVPINSTVPEEKFNNFYSYVRYDENTPIYRFFPTEDEYLISNNAYYTIDKLDTTDTITFSNTNQMKFKGGVHKYYTYDPTKDKYKIVPEGQKEPIDGEVYYTFKPTGKMQYIPYDYYKDAWINAATRDYLDMYFHEPGWEAYVPFNAVPRAAVQEGKTYWAKKSNGQFQQLDKWALTNYFGDYVYEKWEEDAIAEVNSLYSFEVESTELTAYAQDLLSLIGDFLDWADYEQESRMEFLNAIDLFGIKRALLISKLKKLQKKYPDVEKYRREDLLEFLGVLQTEYNQDLRIELSVISDPNAVNFVPTTDNKRKANKKYYYFKMELDPGEVSATYVPTLYEDDVFAEYVIDDVKYYIRKPDSNYDAYDLGSLIIYEGQGTLLELIDDINSAIDTVQDSEKEKTLKELSSQLETIKMESWVTLLNPFKMYKSYKALVSLREMIAAGRLNPSNNKDKDVYKAILDFYQMFITGNNSIDNGIWNALGFLSNDAIPFYIQAAFNRAEITQSVNELMVIVNNWLLEYKHGETEENEILIPYTGKEIKEMIEDGTFSEITAYLLNEDLTPSNSLAALDRVAKTEDFESTEVFNRNNIGEILLDRFYYIKGTRGLSEYDRYDKIRQELILASDSGTTYVKVNTETTEPNPNVTYYLKEKKWNNAKDTIYNSGRRYYELKSIAGIEKYVEIFNIGNFNIDDEGAIKADNIFYISGIEYKPIKTEVIEWETINQDPVEYYIKQETLIDYSKNVTYNVNLQKALNALEDVMSFKFDAYNELVTGNEIFDAVIKEITSFTIIWHLEKSEREQVVAGLQLLIDLAKKLSALQISDRFIDFCLDRRYEGHKRRALNTGFAANRNVIKKLNNGEEYVLAFSLGRYYEGEEPPTYTKTGSVSYGDIENKYYYFDNDPTGIGDFALRTDDYKEIMYGEPNYANPYGWMELEGNFELATTDDTIAPIYYCIAQEKTEGKFTTRFVRPDSEDLNRVFYYPDEKGDYIRIKHFDGPFTTEKTYVPYEGYDWFNWEYDKVLLRDGSWKVLYNNKLFWEKEKREAQRFRRSPTYICLQPKTEIGVDNQTLHFGCAPYELLNPQNFIKLDDAQMEAGPQENVQYYNYDYTKSIYKDATFNEDGGFTKDLDYYVKVVKDQEVQVFKRTTKSSSEGAYKRSKVASIEGIESDHDFYRIITLSDKVMGPQRDEEYFIYDDQNRIYKSAGELEVFDENTDYYIKTYDRRHFSLYNVADDKYPDLYYFVPDDKGDYVHIIRKETVETVDVKWYQFWLKEDNMNKIYREFKDGQDELNGAAPHYFKRYNKDMDYDFHKAAWKDGKFGAWKEKYQRYSKVRVYIYDNTALDDEYTYWTSNPFSDGSECYTYYNYEETERYTLHKRYRGQVNGVHTYWTIDDAIKAADDKYTTATNHRNVFNATFNAPNNFKDYNHNSGVLNYNSGNFKIDLGVRMVPVKIATRTFTAYENETDSQRVPYVMYKKKDNYKPDAGIDWVYCTNPNESDTGYYRPCTVDDENLYTNWQIAETVDDLLGLYDILKVKDPINWESDNPPFEYATPIAVSLPAHQFAMRVIHSLNTPYWWGTIKRHYFANTEEGKIPSKEWYITMVRNFWNWGYKTFNRKAWCWITNASCADEYTRELEKAQDWTDNVKEKIARDIRNFMKFFDFTSDDRWANDLLQKIDGIGLDILADDPDYILIDTDKYTPASGVYYIKQKIDGKTYYVLWEPEIKENEALTWDPEISYFIREDDIGDRYEGFFYSPDNEKIGQLSYVDGSDSITYYYYPPSTAEITENSNDLEKSYFFYKPISKEEAENLLSSENVFRINAMIKEKKTVGLDGEAVNIGHFIKVEKIEDNVQYYTYTYDNTFTTLDTASNRTIEAREQFYSAMEALFGSQWSDWIERDSFAAGGQAFLGTKGFFTNKILEELYTYSELYVKEIRDGQMKMIPFDDISHGGKDKFYRHTYTGDLRDAADGISEIYYNDGGVYKYYSTKGDYDSRVTLNYDGLKVSFCEYDYEAAVFRINPEQTDDSFNANLDYDGNHKVYLDFNCSDPIEGYFDLTIAPEIEGIEEGKPDVPAIKERYIWWKAPVQHSYNLTEDLYNRVGTLFYTQNQNIKDYPIIGAQLFKYKAYKSNNIEILLDFKKQFGEYEIRRDHNDTYEPTFEEYRILKKAFQGYFGMEEWNKVEAIMDIDYLGRQHNFDTYQSYLHMLCMYLNENGERVEYIKDRIVYNPETGQYSFKFKNRRPIIENSKVSADAVKLELKYYEGCGYKDGKVNWDDTKIKKTINNIEGYINPYEQQEAAKDLQLLLANFDQINLDRFYTYFKNMAYKYSMYKVHTGDITDDTNYYGERPDPKDNYYKIKEVDKDTYALEMIDGLSEFPNEDIYRARLLTNMEILKPQYKYEFFKYNFTDNTQISDFNDKLAKGTDFYWFGYKKIDNHDTMFKFNELAKPVLDDDGNPIIDPITGKPKKEEYYDTNIDYYKKSNGLWTWAEELSYSKEYVKPYVEADGLVEGETYYYYDEDKEKFIEIKNPDFTSGITYYIVGEPKLRDELKVEEGEPVDKYIYSEYGPRGNISYYTWDNALVYYREDCEYYKQPQDQTEKYQGTRRYYYHEEPNIADNIISNRLIEEYGELYPYFDNYEILTDINEEIYNKLLPQLSKQVKDYESLSFQQSVDCFVYEPENLYSQYWYPLVDIQSEDQFKKYFAYQGNQITGFSDNAPFGIYRTNHGIKQYFKPGTDFYELESIEVEDYTNSILEPSKEVFLKIAENTYNLFTGDNKQFQAQKLGKKFVTKTKKYKKIPRDANGYQPYIPFERAEGEIVEGEKYYLWNSEIHDWELAKDVTNLDENEYYKEKKYYMTSKHSYVSREEIEENYIILAPYEKLTETDFSNIQYEPNITYWTFTLLKHQGEYDNSKAYYKQVYVPKEITLNETYDSDTIYLKPIKNQYFYTREITMGAKINSKAMSEGVRANLRVTYQLVDGIDAVWPFEPETFENVLLFPNANEGYLARLIEEEAYKLRKEDDKWYERTWNPNPFKAFVCDGVDSVLIGIDNIEEGATYEAVVTLDTRTLAGHHNIAEDYDPNDLHWLASLNDKAAEWWDQEMARQSAHKKKAEQSWNDFWTGLFGGKVEEGPENYAGLPNGTNEPVLNDADDNVVIIDGKVREPNLFTILLPNEIEQKWTIDDKLEAADARIEDFFTETIPETFKEIQTNATTKYQEVTKDIKEVFENYGDKTKEVVTETIDYIADEVMEINSSIASGVTKAVDDISTGLKTVGATLGKIFRIGGSFALIDNFNNDGMTDEEYSYYLAIINNDAEVNKSISDRLTNELQKSLILSSVNGTNPLDPAGMASYAGQLGDYLFEVATFVRYIQQLGYYDFLRDGNYLANTEDFYSTFEEKYSTPEFINRVLSETYKELITSKYIMALPGEVPDNDDLIISNYYLYDGNKEGADDIDTLVYDYVGNDALDYYIYDYDDLCQKVRSITAKEKNYLSIIQSINEKFECWSKFELAHYTEEENAKLSVSEYDKAHTPGEVKMIERVVWVAEDDETDIVFEPLNIPNSHISDKQNKEISALTQFNPKDYWEVRKDYQEWNGYRFKDGVDYYEENQTGKFIKVNREETPIPDGQVIYYIKINNVNLDKVEKAEDKTYYRKIQMVPDKKLFLKQFTGDLNFAGFKYGINLKSIKRTLDSKELVSRLIVKENTNEHAIDGFCTIQRAAENPIKESFILNFDYYIQHQMLKRNELWRDLYDLKDGYYCQLATINKDLDWLANEIAEVNECLDRINAKYETYSLARDAAQEEIENMAVILSEYMPEGVPSPWKYNMAKETEVLRTAWSDTKVKEFTTKDENGNVVEMTEHVVQGQSHAIEIPKYGEEARKNIEQMDIFQKNYAKYQGLAEKAKEQKEHYENLLKELYEKSDNMYRMKTNLNLLFFKKYYRFIQEGTWKKDDYMDDTLYYLDALAVARTSAFPKVTYDISTIDLYNLDDYKGYSFGIGDKTYIEDTEFFGYTNTGKPYQEETIVTKLEYVLDEPSKNKITVKNYKTQFEDLFQRIAAAVSKVELQTGGYNMANAAINGISLGAPGQGEILSLPGTIEMVNGTVEIGKSGIITTETGSTSNKLKFVNGALYRTIDGGETYQRLISAETGINPAMIGRGKLDITSMVIGSKDRPELSLTANGLTAFRKEKGKVDYSTLVRFDSYGVYGIKDYKRNSSTDDASNATLNDAFVPTDINSIYENGSFGLTWDGFFLNTGDNTGRVSIGTENDLRMATKNSHGKWDDRIVIGKLKGRNDETYYGFRIIDDRQNIVLNTDDRGQLYLRHKLHISHFNDEVASVNPELVSYIQVTPTPEDKEYYVYDEDNKIFVKAEREYGYIFDAEETYYILEENKYIPIENPQSNLEVEYYTKTIVKEEDEDKEVYIKFDKVLINDPDVIYYEKQKIITDKKLEQTNVALGIVKAYKRNLIKIHNLNGEVEETYGYEKGQDLHDDYSSLDYLTKILSVKSAVDGYDLKGALKDKKNFFKQFTKEQLEVLIDPNENLAIFDNGNLYAKNAWIEGTINATDGKFTGEIEAITGKILGTLTVGEQAGISIIGGETGIIKSSNYDEELKTGWMIDANGHAVFNELEVEVKIETDEIFSNMSISGISKVEDTLIVGDENGAHIKIETLKIDDVKTGAYIQSSNYEGGTAGWKIDANGKAWFNDVNISGILSSAIFQPGKIQTISGAMLFRPSYEILEVTQDDRQLILKLKDFNNDENFYTGCWVKPGTNLMSNSIDIYCIHYQEGDKIWVEIPDEEDINIALNKFKVGEFVVSVLFYGGATTAVGINASNATQSIIPPESVSVFDMNYVENNPNTIVVTPKVILGKINYTNTGLDGTYGLYADNAYLKGTIIAKSGNIGGVTIEEESLHTNNNNFVVTKDGNVTIKGIVEANEGKIGNVAINEDGSLTGPNDNFNLSANGILDAKAAIIEGVIRANSGFIGNIGIVNIKNEDGSIRESYIASGKWNGQEFIESTTEGFKINSDGTITAKGHIEASGGKFTGEINAGSGCIGNVYIYQGGLYSQTLPTFKDGEITSTHNFMIDPTGNISIIGAITATKGQIGKLIVSEDGTLSTDYFTINANGKVTLTEATIEGVITASRGYIGDIQIGGGGLYSVIKEDNTRNFELNRNGILKVQGAEISGTVQSSIFTKGSEGWKISQDGTAEFNSITVRNGTVSGSTITGSNMSAGSGDSSYELDSNGILIAKGADIAGIITATGGYIGNVAIIDGGLKSGVYDEENEEFKANNNFILSKEGILTVNNAEIRGHIEAGTGNIGNVYIKDGGLYSQKEPEFNEDGELTSTHNFVIDKDGNVSITGTIIATEGTFTGRVEANEGYFGNIGIVDGKIASGSWNEEEFIFNDKFIIDSEGKITTTDGYILGKMTVGSDSKIIINGSNGSIYHQDEDLSSWEINANGTARFSEVQVSGVISSAIFEYEKIQSLGGAMIVRPTYKVKEQDVVKEEERTYLILTLDGPKTNLVGFEKGNYCRFGHDFNREEKTEEDKRINLRQTHKIASNNGNIIKIDVTGFSTIDEEGKEINDFDNIKIDSVISIKGNDEDAYALGLNSTIRKSIIPSRSFSLVKNAPSLPKDANGFEIEGEGAIYKSEAKIVLGELSTVEGINSNYLKKDGDKIYGLYADNVLLEGSLVTLNGDYSAGISTSSIHKIDGIDLIFWAGQETTSLEWNPSFYVNKEGYLYAKNGYFEGEISSSIIRTSTILGNGTEEYGLSILADNSGSNTLAIVFGEGEYNDENNKTYISKTYFSLDSSKLLSTIDFEIKSSTEATTKGIINNFGVSNKNSDYIGLFGTNEYSTQKDYLFNFSPIYLENEKVEVGIYYLGSHLATVNEEGIHLTQNNNSWGDDVYFEALEHGCDIYVK